MAFAFDLLKFENYCEFIVSHSLAMQCSSNDKETQNHHTFIWKAHIRWACIQYR